MLDLSPHMGLDITEPAPDAAPCGSYWAVAQTHPQAEHWAKANLDRQGFATYLPLCRVRIRDRAVPTLFHTVQRPLFTSYLFVVVGRHWAPIQHSRGVRRLLMSDGKPGIVPDTAVEAVRSALHGAEQASAIQQRWTPGTPCSLATGALAGHPALVLEVSGSRATVAVLLFGALRQMSVPTTSLAPRE